MRVLIVEDEFAAALLTQRLVSLAGHQPFVVRSAEAAIEELKVKYFHILLTDWMMPGLDGLQLIRHVRASIFPTPVIVLLTSVDSPEARRDALGAGADEYLVKPANGLTLKKVLDSTQSRQRQPLPTRRSLQMVSLRSSQLTPKFAAVGIAASTGGPEALESLLLGISQPCPAAIVIVQHGPVWMMETLCKRLTRATRHTVQLATVKAPLEAGTVYLAPGDHHLVVDSEQCFQLLDTPPENGVRPAADPLFRSLAKHFGSKAIAIVLTGLGRDGAVGAENIKAAGGHVIAQDPATATARFMPEAVVALGLVPRALPLESIPRELQQELISRQREKPLQSTSQKSLLKSAEIRHGSVKGKQQ